MAKTTGRRGQRRCECGAPLPAYGAARCTSCRHHAGEPGAVEQAAAERAAEREVARSDKALRAKYGKAARKRVPSPAELANDPSLRWCGYRRFELVWSDAHGTEMRFVDYNADGTVSLANMAMGEVPGKYDPLSIRRPTARAVEDKVWAGKYGSGARPRGEK